MIQLKRQGLEADHKLSKIHYFENESRSFIDTLLLKKIYFQLTKRPNHMGKSGEAYFSGDIIIF